MSATGFTFDSDFELDIICQSLHDEAYLKAAVRVCDAHHFGTREASWIWKCISECWNSFHERISARLITLKAAEDFPDPEKRKPYLVLALRLFRSRGKAPKAALDQLVKFVDTVNLQLALEEGAKALEKGDNEKVHTAISKASRSRVDVQKYTHIQWIEQFEARQSARKYEKEHPDEFVVIPTGIKKLDKVLAGGLRKGELGLVLASTGRGKSIMLTNIAHAGISRGFGACYFSLEMPAKQVAMRADTRWSRFEYNQFKAYDFKPSELRELTFRHKKALKQYENKFHIISMPIKSADIRAVRAALDDLKSDYGFVPDILLMDSGDHLKAMDKTLDSYRLQQAEVYWALKQLAEEDGMAVWSSTHAGREWATETATAEATSESYDKARIADLVLSINDPNAKKGKGRKTIITSEDDDVEPEEEKGFTTTKAQRLELFLAKYRDGESKLKIELDAEFSKMYFREVGEESAA